MENSVKFLRKLKTELHYDPAIPLLGTYLDKIIIQKDTCTTMFIAALFTIAKTWKQPKCPLTNEWRRKMWYMRNGILLGHKKEQNNAICSNMDATRDYQTNWISQRKTTYISHVDTMYHMWYLKYGRNEHIYKTETHSQMQRTELWLPSGRRVEDRRTGSLGLAYVNYYI